MIGEAIGVEYLLFLENSCQKLDFDEMADSAAFEDVECSIAEIDLDELAPLTRPSVTQHVSPEKVCN